ncbi:MAG: class I SAM-dependent methyltransferase [Solirubrobacteraceae bacterium]
MDADAYRQASLERWQRAAGGWARRREALQRLAGPVSRWMVDAVSPRPGQVVLELAAGPGDTGLMAAELVAPSGTLICSDFAEPMLEVARERARELGVANVEFRALNAESLDLETASVDGVLCRWGYMLLADPAAGLRETRRVLRPGGRVALAAWDAPERNHWVALGAEETRRRLEQPPPAPDEPGMFAFAPAGRIEALLAQAGFVDVEVDALDLEMAYRSFEDWWETTLDLSRPFAEMIESRPDPERADIRAALREALAPFAGSDGALAIPGRTLVAAAGA